MNSLTPTEFVAVVNQTLEYAYSSVMITGEVASFKVNQGKWVFFDLKDETTSVSCFMTLWSLRVPLEDGMKVTVRAVPKLTKWGKFSLTVDAVKPVGEGSLKKAYELLKKKLAREGLFDEAKKRKIPEDLTRVGVISSTGAAGYADFIKIINARWGGMKVEVAHTQVQGMDAPDQMIKALKYFNEHGEVQIIAILRGGGSADDLSCFNDERLVREIAASRIPVICGIGHEVDESLADLAADVRASTPSNAAELLTKDKKEEKEKLVKAMSLLGQTFVRKVEQTKNENHDRVAKIGRGLTTKFIEPLKVANRDKITAMMKAIKDEYEKKRVLLEQKKKVLSVLNPEDVLARGYAIINGEISLGNVVKITTYENEMEATITSVKERNKDE